MSKYVGITIGPIYDTLKMTSKPAGLWASSYLMSYIARCICEKVWNKYGNKILIPNVTFDENGNVNKYEDTMKKGVGMFHDRIIFAVEAELNEEDVIREVESEVIEPVKEHVAENILNNINCLEEKAVEKLQQYFRIYSVCVEIKENETVVEKISRMLDIIEYQKQFIVESNRDYIYEFLNDNDVIKNCFLMKNLKREECQLFKDNQGKVLKSIEDLCNGSDYYALVQADGDGMGGVLCNLKQDTEIQAFSEKCLKYAVKASEIIETYSGITIYAGGDDLLFLAPLKGDILNDKEEKETKDILSLVVRIKKLFKDTFVEDIYTECNVSFGVQFVYHNYPLYEAFDMVKHQLFDKGKEKRNSCAVSIQKHSGQSHSFIIRNFSDNKITAQISNLINRKSISREQNDEFLHSVWKHIQEMAPVFIKAKEINAIDAVFANLFDNQAQEKYKGDIALIKEIYRDMQDVVGSQNDLPILDILRFADFYSVKEKRENG